MPTIETVRGGGGLRMVTINKLAKVLTICTVPPSLRSQKILLYAFVTYGPAVYLCINYGYFNMSFSPAHLLCLLTLAWSMIGLFKFARVTSLSMGLTIWAAFSLPISTFFIWGFLYPFVICWLLIMPFFIPMLFEQSAEDSATNA